jgi:hypothetical protein
MSIKKRTGNETPRPAIGKTAKSTRIARFVDLNEGLDEVVKYADEKFVELPANPSEGEALVFDGEKWVAQETPAPADSRPYKVYTALLTQSGTNAPVATVLENTLEVTANWTYSGVGYYLLNEVGKFPLNKTVVVVGDTANNDSYTKVFDDGVNDQIGLFTSLLSNISGGDDGLLVRTPIEIRVYND